jgi:hypothetical protein
MLYHSIATLFNSLSFNSNHILMPLVHLLVAKCLEQPCCRLINTSEPLISFPKLTPLEVAS